VADIVLKKRLTMNLSTAHALSRFLLPPTHRPSYLLLFITSRCKASCGHCFYWKRANRSEQELSLEELEKLAKSIGAILQVTITGGSPELRDDLAEIAIMIGKICKPVNMTLSSNGGEPEKLSDAVAKMLEDVPGLKLTVDISLDGLFEEHDMLRNVPGLFNDVCRSFDALAALRKRHFSLRLGMGLCVSGLNQHSAEKTARWAIEHLPIDNLTPILVRGEPRNPSAISCDPDLFLNVAGLAEERLTTNQFRGYASFPLVANAKDILQKRLIADIAKGRRPRIRCSALRETAVVYPDGAIPGCELRDEIIGNLRTVDMDITRIWRSGNANTFRKLVGRQRCCCWHQCFLSASIMKTPRMWPILLKTMWSLKKNNVIGKQ
jgi:MoaA/NifB/PqqE/SkfB family radical SAM enzyme